MRKIVSFFAFVVIVLTFAACGGKDGNVPLEKNLSIKVQALSDKALYTITPANPDAYFYLEEEFYYEGVEKSVKGKVEKTFRTVTFDVLIVDDGLLRYFGIYKNLPPTQVGRSYKDEEYILYGCCVVKGEDGYPKIAGNVEYVIYKTMPEYTLNGAFSVSDTKTVHFAQSNTWQASSGKYSYDEQWACEHKTSGYPFDLMAWSSINFLDQPFYVPSADEWYYLFKGRNNAIDLCAHATVNGTPGLIILPDNWEKPSNIKLKTDGELGFVWKGIDNWYIQQDANFNGYEKNKFTKEDWQTLEFAGAVFLPAAGSDEYAMGFGEYWSSSSASNTNNAYHLEFSKYAIDLSYLKKEPLPKSGKLSIRPVRVVE